MNINININCDNSAFCDEPVQEVARILRQLAKEIQRSPLHLVWKIRLTDIDGHNVGEAKVTEE